MDYMYILMNDEKWHRYLTNAQILMQDLKSKITLYF